MIEMARKNVFDYFKMFTRAAEYSAQAADLLHNVMQNFDPDTLKEKMSEMHAVEHAADIAKHELNRELARAFITPIEREDIMLLTQELDDVTDAVEDVLLRLYMFNVLSIRNEALEAKADIIMLDNMPPAQMAAMVKLINRRNGCGATVVRKGKKKK